MELAAELTRIRAAASAYAEPEEELVGVVAAEPGEGVRVYLCAYRGVDDSLSWLVLDREAEPVESRALVRDAVSISGLCELAEDVAGGGDLDELRAQLVSLRITENPPGIDEAEAAVVELERTLIAPPRLASPAYLDALAAATRRLELALGDSAASPFAEAMKHGFGAVDELTHDVEAAYKRPLR